MKLLSSKEHPSGLGGIQKIYKAQNGYGASVIKSPFSFGSEKGLWELAVLIFNGNEYNITYDTPITDDVKGHLTWDEVESLLHEIEQLPPINKEAQ